MNIEIGESLHTLYSSANKTPNYALSYLLSSIDIDNCSQCFSVIEEFHIIGKRVSISIDNSNVSTINDIFGNAEPHLIELLLWVAVLFPEI